MRECRDGKSEFGFKYREIKTERTEGEQRLQISTLTHNAIFFQLEGELLISWDEHRDVRIRAGELYFLPRGACVSACIVGASVKYVAVRLEHDIDNTYIYKNALNKIDQTKPYSFSPLPIASHLRVFIDSVKYYIVNGLDCQRIQNIKLLELYYLFRSCYRDEDIAQLLHPILKKNTKFKTFILDNYHASVSIDELAQKANMSRSTFDRTFKENFEMTPHKWIDTQTYILIQRKASEPNVTVKDIMYEAGIHNSSQFTKLCKRLCGVAPSRLIRS